ncbi:MAG: His-Xaa-Ser system protein HxsD [Nanoarchaeota archaeon]|nr:His-Xaa-Ser system protein HxsD [Nanoarchaeota archaeon]
MKTNFDITEDGVQIKINKNIYPKEVLIQTTYVMLDNFYFLIDENDKYWLVFMKFKENNFIDNLDFESKITQAVYNFFDELIESQSYLNQLKRTAKVREIILEKALLSQTLDNGFINELEKDNNN